MKRSFYPVMGDDNYPEYLSVISSQKCGRIKIDDIEVIEQEGRKIHIVTAERDYAIYESISGIIPVLVGRAFYRPIKGLIINFDHVKDITGNTIYFHSGQSISMGKNSISKTRTSYKKYLLNYPPYSLWDRSVHSADKVADAGNTAKIGD